MKSFFVAGTFGSNPKSSKIAEEFYNGIGIEFDVKLNGGEFKELIEIANRINDEKPDLVIWIANVPEDHEKLVLGLKKLSPKTILVTSKLNDSGKYSFQDIIYHGLNIKSNLIVEIHKPDERYYGRVLDPLGNVFTDTSDFFAIGKTVQKRVFDIMEFTRVPSKSIGNEKSVAVDRDFIQLIKDRAVTFHDCIHPNPEAVNRFFGNASFRCELGFPSFKKDKMIYVTKRNIDKRYIDQECFVAVDSSHVHLDKWDKDDDCFEVRYYGKHKPSVDTPIQLLLYQYYKNAKYMIHSHAYILGCDFTSDIIPCGSLEEASEVFRVVPGRNMVNFGINLNGHGSIVVADNVEFMKNVKYVARSIPEYQGGYLWYPKKVGNEVA
jgi:hypothetical protein